MITMNHGDGIGYIRVSSDEQVKGTSLVMQEEKVRDCAKREGINLVHIFRDEGESAKTADRPGLLEALNHCSNNKETVKAFIVYKVDRLARSAEDHFYVRSMLSKHRIRLVSASESIGDNPQDKLMELMLAGFAEFDNAIRKQRCSAGMLGRLKQGIWPWKPPAGYVCAQNKKHGEKKTTPDEPHPQVFPLMQRLLRGYALGTLNQSDMALELARGDFQTLTGVRPSAKYISDILNSHSTLKFYVGLLRNPWAKDDLSDIEFQGKHQPMITPKEYRMIRERLSGNKQLEKREYKENPAFPLRGTILCASCGSKLTASRHKNKYGSEYFHYHCYNAPCPMKGKGLTSTVAEERFVAKLREIELTPQFFQYFREVLLDVWMTRRSRLEGTTNVRTAQLKTLEERKRKIHEAYESGDYSRDMFRERIEQIENEIAVIRITRSEASIDRYDLEGDIRHAQHLMTALDKLWAIFSPEFKRKFQQLVFPHGIAYCRTSGFGTPDLGCIFKAKSLVSDDKTTPDSDLVDPSGFEPLTSTLQMWRSTN